MTLPQYVGCDAISATDGSAVTTGATLEISTNGGTTFAAPTNTASHKKNGFWSVELTAGERGNNQIDVQISGGGSIPQTRTYVDPGNVTAWAGDTAAVKTAVGTGLPNVDVGGVAGGSVSSVDDFKADVSNLDATVSSRATNAGAADAVWDEARSGHTAAGSFGEGVASVQGNVTGSVASVTGNVGGNVVGSVGSVVAEVTADVVAWQGFNVPGNVMIENDGSGNGRWTAKALEQAPSGGGGGLTAQEVWTYSGPEGREITGGAIDTNNDKAGYNVTSGSIATVTGSVGSVTAAVTVGTNNDKTGYTVSSGVWDVALTGDVPGATDNTPLAGDALNASYRYHMNRKSEKVTDGQGLVTVDAPAGGTSMTFDTVLDANDNPTEQSRAT